MNKKCRLIFWLVLAAIPTAYIIYVCYSFAALLEPIEGSPGSEISAEGFEEHIGFPPPPAVSEIHYQTTQRFRDPAYGLRFKCSDEELVQSIVSELGLRESDEFGVGGSADPFGGQCPWWQPPSARSTEDVLLYEDHDARRYVRYLWYRKSDNILYYLYLEL